MREHLALFSLQVLPVRMTGLTILSERSVLPVPRRDVLGGGSLFVTGSVVGSVGVTPQRVEFVVG